MVNQFGPQNRAQVRKADREEVMAGDVNEVTVSSGEWSELFTLTSTNTKRYAPGYGTGDSQGSDAGFSDFDLQNSGGSAIDGNFRWVLYESSDHDVPLVISGKINATQQRASVGESLRDKQLVPGMKPRGQKDRDLVLEFKASSSSDGDTVSQSNSNAEQGLPYSLYRL